MSGSDDHVRTDRSLLLPTRNQPGEYEPSAQLANHDAPGGRGVQREPAYESAAISTPTSKATTFAVAE